VQVRLWQSGRIAVGELWAYHCRHPYLHRLRDRSVLDAGVSSVENLLTWDVEAFAIATGYDESTGRYLGLAIPHQDPVGQITDSTLLVRPDLALDQRDRELAERATRTEPAARAGTQPSRVTDTTGGIPETPAEPVGTAGPEPAHRAQNTRFFGVATVSPDRYARDLTRLSQEIIQHLAAEDVDLDIRVEISARNPSGFSDDKVRNVTENARTLKFETYGFEDQ
jgi:hypothetical protein